MDHGPKGKRSNHKTEWFPGYDTKTQKPKQKENTGKLDFLKIKKQKTKNFYVSKVTIKKVKTQPAEWDKIFSKQI